MFDLLEESGIILSFHVTVFAKACAAFDPNKGSPDATFLHADPFVEQFLDPFVDLFAWSTLERHPKMKIVMAESGVGVRGISGRQGRHPAQDQAVGIVQAAVLGRVPAEPDGDAAARILGAGQSAVGDGLSPSRQHLAQFAQVIEET
ncbi:MAG: Amidohydrolase, partial [Sphingomonas bacterium]|nr:Amidohydrolase [Sphingomonas bacterium]